MSKSTLDVLIEARKLIENEENWGQGIQSTRSNPESCCVSESLERVCGANFVYGERTSAFLMAARALNKAVQMGVSIPTWNDAPERTHAEVLAAFDKAIETTRAQTRATV